MFALLAYSNTLAYCTVSERENSFITLAPVAGLPYKYMYSCNYCRNVVSLYVCLLHSVLFENVRLG